MDMNYGQNNGYMGISPTKQAIKDYISLAMGSNLIEVVDEFDTLRTRHICLGNNVISILEQRIIPVPTTKGMINVSIFYCGCCGKVIINKSSMEVY